MHKLGPLLKIKYLCIFTVQNYLIFQYYKHEYWHPFIRHQTWLFISLQAGQNYKINTTNNNIINNNNKLLWMFLFFNIRKIESSWNITFWFLMTKNYALNILNPRQTWTTFWVREESRTDRDDSVSILLRHLPGEVDAVRVHPLDAEVGWSGRGRAHHRHGDRLLTLA